MISRMDELIQTDTWEALEELAEFLGTTLEELIISGPLPWAEDD